LAEQNLSAAEIRRLYERHSAILLAYARSLTKDAAGAEDVVQEVFAKLLRGETGVPDVPLAYLFRAVKNGALNARRKRSGEAALDLETTWFQHRDGNREAALALQAALGELPEEQRETVMMRVWSGMTLAEIAAATGVALPTVSSRYRYALEKLRERMKPWTKNESKHG
jgi:RNA polymerase sigma-70 factor (ECF subfamily)